MRALSASAAVNAFAEIAQTISSRIARFVKIARATMVGAGLAWAIEKARRITEINLPALGDAYAIGELAQHGYINEAPLILNARWFYNYAKDQYELWQVKPGHEDEWPLLLGSFSRDFAEQCPNMMAMTCIESGWPRFDPYKLRETLLRKAVVH